MGARYGSIDPLNNERSGVYSYQVATNGDYGSAKGLDLTLEWRWAFLGSMLNILIPSQRPTVNMRGQV
ncbi:hypothetical protein Ct9H90mP12_2460 [bacterium]|nr:MAG: hypothetical protein Ct9H90mP12_2460 [bacterium]